MPTPTLSAASSPFRISERTCSEVTRSFRATSSGVSKREAPSGELGMLPGWLVLLVIAFASSLRIATGWTDATPAHRTEAFKSIVANHMTAPWAEKKACCGHGGGLVMSLTIAAPRRLTQRTRFRVCVCGDDTVATWTDPQVKGSESPTATSRRTRVIFLA